MPESGLVPIASGLRKWAGHLQSGSVQHRASAAVDVVWATALSLTVPDSDFISWLSVPATSGVCVITRARLNYCLWSYLQAGMAKDWMPNYAICTEGARRGGCCYAMAGNHIPTTTNMWAITRQWLAYTSCNSRGAVGDVFYAVHPEAIQWGPSRKVHEWWLGGRSPKSKF